MMQRLPIRFAAAIAVSVLTLVIAGCTDSSPEEEAAEGPKLLAITLQYPAGDPQAASDAAAQCKYSGKTAKLVKSDGTTQSFVCQ